MTQTFKQWLLEASTIPQLDSKTRRAFPSTKKRQNDVGSVTILPTITYTPDINQRQLMIDATTRSRSGKAHTTRIILYKVPFDQNGSASVPNTDIRLNPVKLNIDTSRVACDCMDFRFRFAPHNHKDDSLAGSPPPVYNTVPGSNRGPVNPSNQPGMCKHLYATVRKLKQLRIVI